MIIPPISPFPPLSGATESMDVMDGSSHEVREQGMEKPEP